MSVSLVRKLLEQAERNTARMDARFAVALDCPLSALLGSYAPAR